MEYYYLYEGWLMLVLAGHYRLENGMIVCSGYEVVRYIGKIETFRIRQTMLIAEGEYVDVLVRGLGAGTAELVRVGNRRGKLTHVVVAA